MKNTILSVGWSTELRAGLLDKVEALNFGEIKFFHLVEIGPRFKAADRSASKNTRFVSIPNSPKITKDGLEFLKKIEVEGVPTIRSMIAGDPYLRYLDSNLALGYAELIAKAILETIEEKQPLVVLASNDRLISSIALAVALHTKTQFAAMAFTVLPDNRTWFIDRMTPNSLISVKLDPDQQIKAKEVKQLLDNFYQKKSKVSAYVAPKNTISTLLEGIRFFGYKLQRVWDSDDEGLTRFATLSFKQATANRMRRLLNRLSLAGLNLISKPPQEKYAYFPLHMSPESMIDTWAIFYQNQLELIKQVALAMPLDLSLVIKLHFSDPDSYSARQLETLSKITGVLIANPYSDGRTFIENATLVFGITGTSSLEAALLGKPTIIFGDTPYLEFPNSERAKRPDEISSQIRNLLQMPPPPKEDIETAFEKYANRYSPGRINDWNIPLSKADIEKFSACFKKLVSKVLNEKSNVS